MQNWKELVHRQSSTNNLNKAYYCEKIQGVCKGNHCWPQRPQATLYQKPLCHHDHYSHRNQEYHSTQFIAASGTVPRRCITQGESQCKNSAEFSGQELISAGQTDRHVFCGQMSPHFSCLWDRTDIWLRMPMARRTIQAQWKVLNVSICDASVSMPWIISYVLRYHGVRGYFSRTMSSFCTTSNREAS